MQTNSTTATTDPERASRVHDFENELMLAWLDQEPYYRAALLALAQSEPRQRSFAYAGRTPTDDEILEAEQRHVLRYFRAVFLGACANCYWPIVQFVDGRGLDWPALTLHECAGLATSRPPIAKPRQRPAWKRAVPT